MSRRSLRVLVPLAAGALVLSACGSSGGAGGSGGSGGGGGEGGTVRVGFVNLSIFAPVYVAQSKGYLKDQGLTVELQNVKSGEDAIPLAASGKLEVAAVGFSAGMFSAVNNGLGFKVVGSMGVGDGDTTNPPVSIVVAPAAKASVTKPADLKGKKVAVLGGQGATGAYYLAQALSGTGVSIKDVQLVNLGNADQPAALKNGSVDAAVPSSPFNAQALKDGAAQLFVPPAGTSGTGLIYGDAFTKSPNAQKFFNALAKASGDLQGEKRYSAENIDIIAKAISQDPAALKASPLYTWKPNLAPLPDQLTAMEKAWMESGALTYKEPLDKAKYLDESFAKNVK